MNTVQERSTSEMVRALTARPTPMESFELWATKNRPELPLERKKAYGFVEYASAAVQAEWLAFAAGWALRGTLP